MEAHFWSIFAYYTEPADSYSGASFSRIPEVHAAAPERMPLAWLMASISSRRAFCLAAKFFSTQSHSPWRSPSVKAKDSNSPLVLSKSLLACSLSSLALALLFVFAETLLERSSSLCQRQGLQL